jgi:predicted RND superfamily exporter protein
MLTAILVKTVDVSVRHAWSVIAASVLLVLVSAVYASGHFALNTDVSRLINADAPAARRAAAVDAAFPQRGDSTLVVVQAPAPEFAMQAATELSARLRQQPDMFRTVNFAEGSELFTRSGLLFLSTAEVKDVSEQLAKARPLLNQLARDPSLRGLANLLSVSLLTPLQTGQRAIDRVGAAREQGGHA